MTTRSVAYIKCGCTGGQAAEFQDKQYGKGVRVCNVQGTKNPKDPAREVGCTVCSKIHRTEESKLV